MTIKEFEREKKWWQKREVNEYAWKVLVKEIAEKNYNLDCKNPHEVVFDHGEPEELMAEFLEISQEVARVQDALKQELIEALNS